MQNTKSENYQSIFSKESIYASKSISSSLSEPTKNKKIKTEKNSKKITAIIKENLADKNYNSEFSFSELTKIEKITSIQCIQKLLQWLFVKDMINPCLFCIKYKESISDCMMIFIPGIDYETFHETVHILPTLSKYYNAGSVGYFKNSLHYSIGSDRFWELLFASNPGYIPQNKQKNKKAKISNVSASTPSSMEEKILSLFKENALSMEELDFNLYPSYTKPIFNHYIKTSRNLASQIANETDKPDLDLNNKKVVIEKDTNPQHQKIDIENDKCISKFKNIVACDCEMVRTEHGLELARISLIDYDFKDENKIMFNVLYDEYILPENEILDYLTKFSGITRDILSTTTKRLADAQKNFLKYVNEDTILVGHSLENDLKALQIIHEKVVDTAVLYQSNKGFKNSLKTLAHTYLHLDIQHDSHNSIEDAKISLALAKLKVEILDNFDIPKTKKYANLDILDRLTKSNKTILPIDTNENLQPLLKHSIYYDELKESNVSEIFSKIIKWVRLKKTENKKAPNIIATVLRDLCRTQDDDNNIEEGDNDKNYDDDNDNDQKDLIKEEKHIEQNKSVNEFSIKEQVLQKFSIIKKKKLGLLNQLDSKLKDFIQYLEKNTLVMLIFESDEPFQNEFLWGDLTKARAGESKNCMNEKDNKDSSNDDYNGNINNNPEALAKINQRSYGMFFTV